MFMDKIEQYYQRHSNDLDLLDPPAEGWQDIADRLDKPAKGRKWLPWVLVMGLALILGSAFFIPTLQPEDESFADLNQLEVGDPFPQVSLANPQGQMVDLKDLQGKIVLVEFWASYSMVCTETQCYYFKPIYEQYADQGFEIYGISLDTNAQQWTNAIEADDLPWVNVSGMGTQPAGLGNEFNNESLPSTYLLDQQGHIIAKDIKADELESVLENLLVLE